MHIARLILVSLLILTIVFTYSSFVRGEISQVWVVLRPDVIESMDRLYATIRNFVAGTDSQDGIDNNAPVNFDEIITREPVSLL